jgi:ubiquitin-protein ligase
MGRDPSTSPVRKVHGLRCSLCPGGLCTIQVPEVLADINEIVRLVAQLNYDVSGMESLGVDQLLAATVGGADGVVCTLHNNKEGRFMSGGGGDDMVELESDAETRFCQWVLEPVFEEKVKPNVAAVTMGRSWAIKNVKTGTYLGMEPGAMPEDVRNIMSPGGSDPEDCLYTLEWQPTTKRWGLKNEQTRRYVHATSVGELNTYAGASTYLKNKSKVFPVSALGAHWAAYSPPKSAFDLVEEFFVVECPTHGRKLCAGCGKEPHLKAKSTPCRACNYLRTAVLLQALQSAVSGKSLFGDSKDAKSNKKAPNSQRKKKKKGLTPSKKGPKSGIGYGGNSGVDVNTTQLMMDKQEENKRKASKLLRLVEDLSFCLSQPSLLTGIPPSFYALLHQSDLNKILSDYIRVGSVMEMAKVPGLYINLMELTKILSSNQNFIALLRPDRTNMAGELGSHHSPIQLLDGVLTQAKVLLQSTGKDADDDDEAKKDGDEAKLLQFAESVVNTADSLTIHTRTYIKNQKDMEKLFAAAQAAEGKTDSKMESKIAERERREVEDLLKSQGFGLVPLTKGRSHYFQTQINEVKSKNSSVARNMRIRQEMASLSAGTPPGIFVRFDSNRFDVLHCMIIGADETPYEKGCFLFDMFLPQTYPQVPPKCQFLTTGKGQFRFNANLYSAGKVCLSLLGTWQGPGWDPKISTILQVLLSIQSLIMCPDVSPLSCVCMWSVSVLWYICTCSFGFLIISSSTHTHMHSHSPSPTSPAGRALSASPVRSITTGRSATRT